MWFGKNVKIRSMREPVYRVHVDTFACRTRITVNDCPVMTTPGTRSLEAGYTVNDRLLPGKNPLRIQVEPPQGRDALDQERAFLRGKVTAGDMTVPPERRENVELLTFEVDLATDTSVYPIAVEHEFDVPTGFPAWSWARASVLTMNDGLRAEAARVIQSVWEALQQRDLDRVLELQRVRMRELSQSVFQRLDERVADTRGDLERLTGDATNRLRPLDANAYDYALFADGRMVRVDSPAGLPPIRYDFQQTTMFAGIPLLLARNEYGRLEWVR
jgi:hypothetical protein